MIKRWKPLLIYAMRRAHIFASRRLWVGARSGVGALFVVGGVFGFLPILGFWMIPVGLLLIATDIPPLRRPLRRWLRQERNGLSEFERRYPRQASRAAKTK